MILYKSDPSRTRPFCVNPKIYLANERGRYCLGSSFEILGLHGSLNGNGKGNGTRRSNRQAPVLVYDEGVE